MSYRLPAHYTTKYCGGAHGGDLPEGQTHSFGDGGPGDHGRACDPHDYVNNENVACRMCRRCGYQESLPSLFPANDLQASHIARHGKPFELPAKFLPGYTPKKRQPAKHTNPSTEKETQTAVLGWLQAKGIFHYRQNSGVDQSQGRWVRYGTPGAPDIIVVIRGCFIGIEVKDIKPSAKLNENQERFKARLEIAGGVWITARRLEDVTEELERLGLI